MITYSYDTRTHRYSFFVDPALIYADRDHLASHTSYLWDLLTNARLATVGEELDLESVYKTEALAFKSPITFKQATSVPPHHFHCDTVHGGSCSCFLFSTQTQTSTAWREVKKDPPDQLSWCLHEAAKEPLFHEGTFWTFCKLCGAWLKEFSPYKKDDNDDGYFKR